MPATVNFIPTLSSYDTSIGLSVTNGFADLTKRAPARYIYVGNGGNDTNDGLTHATRRLTITGTSGAHSLVTNGQGDQILIAEGSTFTDLLSANNAFRFSTGFSAAYPLVVQSYDPADPTNAAKFGKATTNRPVLTAANHTILCDGVNNLVFRGIKFDAGNIANGVSLAFIGAISNCLIENCIFAYGGCSYDWQSSSPGPNHIFRRCSFYGVWGVGNVQSLYLANASNNTVEDCLFYHSGWKIGGLGRDDVNEGTTALRHAVYPAVNCDLLARRNLFLDPSATGLSVRGGLVAYDNLFMKCPIAVGQGVESYNTHFRPTGVDVEVYNNAIFIATAIVTGGPVAGWGIVVNGTRTGSSAHHNLVAHSRSPIVGGYTALRTHSDISDDPDPGGVTLTTTFTYNNNRVIKWDDSALSNMDMTGTNNATGIFVTYTNNVMDVIPVSPFFGRPITTSGNTSNSGLTYTNEYTSVDALAAALGYTDEVTWIAAFKDRPDLNWTAVARTKLGVGYDMVWA